MTAPIVYVPYPTPQTTEELEADINALVNQPGVPTSLTNAVYSVEDNPQTAADVDAAEANNDSMANE
ncbi:hypothetical protein UFOVP41_10 [uncultured Caudovirales phage]|uniref:Uncharacterized protein n=1 Tax=uncultured Caudovirales phage TaxID=2100421 RepID=A0A6J5KR10_9CAUD|nr:hypothetical protein UFOVP41_10 [uncultured Caudovirales phage]